MILTVVRARPRPPRAPGDEGDALEIFCRRLQIISRRDMDGTVTVVFRSMLMQGRIRPVGSSELAEMTRLNRVTIIHHLQRLEQMGLVEHTERKYRLRVHDLSEAVEQMREEMMRSFEEAESLATQLDKQMGMDEPHAGIRPPLLASARNAPSGTGPRSGSALGAMHERHLVPPSSSKRRPKRIQS